MKNLLFSAVIALLAIASSVNGQSQRLLDCICQIESGCQPLGCHMDAGSDVCGYYQIRQVYWLDGGTPGTDFNSCAISKTCSETAVRNYLTRYGTMCTGGAAPTDQDYARIHNGGPSGCKAGYTVGYWNLINACLAAAPTTSATTQAATTKAATTQAPTTTTVTTPAPTTKASTTPVVTVKSGTTQAPNTTAATTQAPTTAATTQAPTTTAATTKAPTTASGVAPSQHLLDCMCQTESGCAPLKCVNGFCGYYQITSGYWQDCGAPGGSLEACGLNKTCSENCIRAYSKRYGTYCTGGRTPTDQDVARIHNGGPGGCSASYTLPYWTKISACLAGAPAPTTQAPTTVATQAPTTTAAGGVSRKLLDCMCQTESGCAPLKCVNGFCGYFQITWGYWADCGSPGGSLEACGMDKTCSENCVRAYAQRYGTYCTGGRAPTEQDVARIHNGGPGGCGASYTLPYWTKISACLAI